MNPKKLHEVTRLGAFITQKAQEKSIAHLVDLGAGQGYLSHLLATRGGFSVTGIEAKDHNSHEAEKRSKFLTEKLQSQVEYKAVSLYANTENLEEYTTDPCMIIGLHTCGDLAATSLKLFVNNHKVKGIVNVGCCYNHLSEYVADQAQPLLRKYISSLGVSFKGMNLDESVYAPEETAGYPLSNYLKKRHPEFFLGRMSRVLSMSEANKSHLENPESTLRKFVYRAAFQDLLKESYPGLSTHYCLGRKIKRYLNFGDYSAIAFSKMNLDLPYSPDEMQLIYERKYQQYEKPCAVFWSLRSVLSGVIENLVLLDRAMFLQENGCHVELRQVFEKDKSPRNVAIAAIKP
mgnify:FL=1